MSEMVDQLPWMQVLLLTVLLVVGLALRQWGKGRAPAIGMAVLWSAVAIAIAGLGWSLAQALRLIQAA